MPKTPESSGPSPDITRRRLLAALGVGAAGVAAVAVAPGSATAAPRTPNGSGLSAALPAGSADPITDPAVQGLHLQFGNDPATEVTVSWQARQSVSGPRVVYLSADNSGSVGNVAGREVTYTDDHAAVGTKTVVHVFHTRLTGLNPDTDYTYAAAHDGATPQFGTFRTAPAGRAAFTFTSFGDQGTPTVGKRYVPPAGVTIANPPYVNDNLGSPAASDTTAGVERVAPLLHLFNGDLCYANLSQDRVRTWQDFWNNNTRSARNRPWMPSAGNHENELGNGSIGYRAYQRYFELPHASGQTSDTRGLWYSFDVGSVHFVSLQNDDICYQDGGNSYVRGYSDGAQKAWLTGDLAAARANKNIDWIVVCMHQVAISTANNFNGADLGIRREWLPLFDRYGVDLVVCGHEHHYERSLPIRGHRDTPTRTPQPVARRTDVINTENGTVHMIIGGGGTSAPSNGLLFDPPQCRVIVSVGKPDPSTGKRPPNYVYEDAPWASVRDQAQAYGFAAFEVDPGTRPGGPTTIAVTYYEIVGTYGELQKFDTFTLRRSRSDG